jgi:hypothetical protein
MVISIDNSQKETFKSSWHCDQSSFLTATGDDYEELFPLDAETEKNLQVPSLDDIDESFIKKNVQHKYVTFLLYRQNVLNKLAEQMLFTI